MKYIHLEIIFHRVLSSKILRYAIFKVFDEYASVILEFFILKYIIKNIKLNHDYFLIII